MASETSMDSAREPVPGTPGIREVRSDCGFESFALGTDVFQCFGIRKVGLRAEIDTSPPFGPVKEAVTRFGGGGLHKFGETYGVEEFDIKKVEEQAAELEKDLIVKELETVDVLEELGSTKKLVEELKLQLQKCMSTPDEHISTPSIKEMNKEYRTNYVSNNPEQMLPCPVSSPDWILMELKQAKLNLGRTINDLGVIQTSVESLNKRLMKEKILLGKIRERLTSRFSGASSVEDPEIKQVRSEKPQVAPDGDTSFRSSTW